MSFCCSCSGTVGKVHSPVDKFGLPLQPPSPPPLLTPLLPPLPLTLPSTLAALRGCLFCSLVRARMLPILREFRKLILGSAGGGWGLRGRFVWPCALRARSFMFLCVPSGTEEMSPLAKCTRDLESLVCFYHSSTFPLAHIIIDPHRMCIMSSSTNGRASRSRGEAHSAPKSEER